MVEMILTAASVPEMSMSAENVAELDMQGVSLKGDKGDKGEPGYSPVKGVDYWTEEDKNEIVTEVDENISAELDKKVDKENGKGLSTVTDIRVNDSPSRASRIDITYADGMAYTASYYDPYYIDNVLMPQYVKKTDYASDIAAGVVKYYPGLGIVVNADGTMQIDAATNDDIDKKLSYYKPITPARLDYALKPYIARLKEQSVPHSEVSASPAVLTDALAGEGFRELKVYGALGEISGAVGDADGNKYKIPIRCCGKNMIPYPYASTTRTVNGITYTDNGDGTITINGTATGAAYFDFAQIDAGQVWCEAGKTYTYSWNGDGTGKPFWGFVRVDGNVLQARAGSVTFTPAANQYIRVSFVATEGASFTNVTIKPQLEVGTSATAWEKYISGGSMTATLDTQLTPGERIDVLNKKRYSSDGAQTDITVSGKIEIPESGKVTIWSDTQVSPPRIDVGYWQDINKVISEMKNAVLAQGGNV